MSNLRVIRNSFSGGEISPLLLGRMDTSKYQNGCGTARNMTILPFGTAINRAGFRVVREVKLSAFKTRIISFSYSNSQTFCIEVGVGYFRFHTLGGTLEELGVPYEIANPYAENHLLDIKYTQSGNTITLVHPEYEPRELIRISNTNWTLTVIPFESDTLPPGSVTVVKTQPAGGGATDHSYKVTSLNSEGFEESLASILSNVVSNNLTLLGNYNDITWPVVAGAVRYNVYKKASGNFGFIGQTTATQLKDDNIIADMSRTVPISNPPFIGENNYPGAVGYFEQRRFFGGTNLKPTNVWATQSGSDYNMNYTIPSIESDSLRFRMVGNKADQIRHIFNLQDLIVLTASTEWRVFSGDRGALVAATTTIRSQSHNGASNVTPVLINEFLLYEQSQGGHVRELSYDWQNNGYKSNDISLMVPHLFDNYKIIDMCFTRAPHPILWATSTSGKLLSMTYVPEHEISAWSSHDTIKGKFESCTSVTENDQDTLYVVVNRLVNGVNKRFIEVADDRKYQNKEDAFFVDSGLTYEGPPVYIISGFDHLEGEEVAILADGAVQPRQIVVSGKITLNNPASKVHAGIPIESDLKTLPVHFKDPTFGQSRVKNVNKLWVRINESGNFLAGPDKDRLTPLKVRSFEPLGSAPELKTGEFPLVISPDFNQSGQVLLRQSDPLPMEIVYIASEVSIGG